MQPQRRVTRRSGLPLRVHRFTRLETLIEADLFLSPELVANRELNPLTKVLCFFTSLISLLILRGMN